MEYFFKKYLLPNFLIVQMIFSPLQGFSYDSRDEEQARKNSTRYNWKTGESRTGFYFTVEDVTLLKDVYHKTMSRLSINKGIISSTLFCLKYPHLVSSDKEKFELCNAFINNRAQNINNWFSEMRVNLALSQMTYFQNELVYLDPARNPYKTNSAISGIDPEFENPILLDQEYYYVGKIKFLFYEENGFVKNHLYKSITPKHQFGISLFSNGNTDLAELGPLNQVELKLAYQKLKDLEEHAFLCAYGELSDCPLPPPPIMKQYLELKKELFKNSAGIKPSARKLLSAKISNGIKYAAKNYVYEFYKQAKESVFEKEYRSILSAFPILGFISKPIEGNPWKSVELKHALEQILLNIDNVNTDFSKYFNENNYDMLLPLITHQPVVDGIIEDIKLNESLSEEEKVSKVEKIKTSHTKLSKELRTRKMTRETLAMLAIASLSLPCAAVGNVFGASACGVFLSGIASVGQFRYSRYFYENEFSDFFSTDIEQYSLADLSELDARQSEMVFAYIFLGVVPGGINFLKLVKPQTRQTIEILRNRAKIASKRIIQ